MKYSICAEECFLSILKKGKIFELLFTKYKQNDIIMISNKKQEEIMMKEKVLNNKKNGMLVLILTPNIVVSVGQSQSALWEL